LVKYDKKQDLYTISLLGETVTLTGDKVKSIQRAYVRSGEDLTMHQTGVRFGLSDRQTKRLLNLLGVTKDSLPVTDVELSGDDLDTLCRETARAREAQVSAKVEKERIQRLETNAAMFDNLDQLSKHLANTFKAIEPSTVCLTANEREKSLNPLTLVVGLSDLHYGNAAWGSLEHARGAAGQALSAVLGRAERMGTIEQAIVPIGSDNLHADNLLGQTTKSTVLQMVGDPADVIDTWFGALAALLDQVRSACEHMTLVYCPGNHDRLMSLATIRFAEAYYRNDHNVRVLFKRRPRQYMMVGDNLLSFAHGDAGASKDWPAVMAAEEPALWGRAKTRHLFVGHLHNHKDYPVFGGVEVHQMPSLCPPDRWHLDNGYVGAERKITGYLFNSHDLIGQVYGKTNS
jgi:hypothetical protein